MNEDLKIIKKKYGEKMMHLCRYLFPILLETEGLLSKLLIDNFDESHLLYDDIVNNDLIDEFKNYIYSFFDVEKNKVITNKTPKELMSDAGYNLYECRTIKDVEKFRKYYEIKEELCTFRDIKSRLERNVIFFAVKKNVDEIKREDFDNPQRQDEYGTSVISLQFTKDDSHTLSIKNRYNHSVNNSDATFSNNLENIISGLTESFEREYGLIQKNKNNDFGIQDIGYVKASDGKYYKYNYEINNIYYCPNNVIIDNYEVKKLDKESYIVSDYFILDLKNKKIELYDKSLNDSFIDSITDIKKIDILNEEETKKIVINPNNGEEVIIKLDKANRIIGLKNNNIKEIADFFLKRNEVLEKFIAPKLEKIGSDFLYNNKKIRELELESVTEIEDFFLRYNEVLEKFTAPKLEKIDSSFLCNNKNLRQLELESVTEIENNFLYYNQVLEKFIAPKLEKIGIGFLHHNEKIKELELESVIKIENDFLYDNQVLEKFIAPKLEKIGSSFLCNNKNLRQLELESVIKIENDFLCFNQVLEKFIAPKLEKIGSGFLYANKKIRELELESVKEIENDFLCFNQVLKKFTAPKLEKIGSGFLYDNKKIRELELESVKEIDNWFLYYNEVLERFIAPKLEEIGRGFLMNNKTKLIDIEKFSGDSDNTSTDLQEEEYNPLGNNKKTIKKSKGILSFISKYLNSYSLNKNANFNKESINKKR